MIDAIILVQDFERAKTRLSFSLNQQERTLLAKRFAQHVIHTVKESRLFEYIWVVSPCSDVRNWAEEQEVKSIPDPPDTKGLAEIVDAAVQKTKHISTKPKLILMSDLPCLKKEDLYMMCESLADADVIIGADRHQLGTNALLLKQIIPTCFGQHDSAKQHQMRAKQYNLKMKWVASEGIAIDVDTQEDLLLSFKISSE